MEELRIKCPSCGAILDVRNSKDEDVKRIVCPNCHKHLAVTFREPQARLSVGMLCYGKASYPLKEGVQTIGLKDPSSTADIQIATGDATLQMAHAQLRVVTLTDGSFKYIVTPCADAPVLVNSQSLQEGDEVMLNMGDTLCIGDTELILKPSKK